MLCRHMFLAFRGPLERFFFRPDLTTAPRFWVGFLEQFLKKIAMPFVEDDLALTRRGFGSAL
jgi:hypothetical protein